MPRGVPAISAISGQCEPALSSRGDRHSRGNHLGGRPHETGPANELGTGFRRCGADSADEGGGLRPRRWQPAGLARSGAADTYMLA